MGIYLSYCNEILDDYLPMIKEFSTLEDKVSRKHVVKHVLGRRPDLAETNDELMHYIKSKNSNYLPVCNLIKNSVKFKMPNGGMLINFGDDAIGYMRKFIDEINLPFKTVALEVEPYFSGKLQNSELVVIANQEDDHIHIYVIMKNKYWVLPQNQVHQPIQLKLNRKSFTYEYNCDFDHYELQDIEKKAMRNTFLWFGLGIFADFISAMSCSNTVIEDHPNTPSKLKNDLRKTKGKLPFFSYKILTIDTHKSKSISNKGTSKNSDHASPRVHLRRGHIRRLEAKNVWVNSCVVGSKSQGLIHKDYLVTQ